MEQNKVHLTTTKFHQTLHNSVHKHDMLILCTLNKKKTYKND